MLHTTKHKMQTLWTNHKPEEVASERFELLAWLVSQCDQNIEILNLEKIHPCLQNRGIPVKLEVKHYIGTISLLKIIVCYMVLKVSYLHESEKCMVLNTTFPQMFTSLSWWSFKSISTIIILKIEIGKLMTNF